MFGSSPTSIKDDDNSTDAADAQKGATAELQTSNNGAEKRTGGVGSPTEFKSNEETTPGGDKKRRSSGVAKARDMFSSAKQSLHLHGSASPSSAGGTVQSPIQKLSKNDPALGVPQGSLNNSAGESMPGPKSTFKIGVTEDKNKKCRRTMEDTHSYLYNFLSTPLPNLGENASKDSASDSKSSVEEQIKETDNGYFAIFDGHAGTFAADWCGKKLHGILEDMIRKNPNTPIPELLDQTFTTVDQQLEKLPLKNSGCTAVIAVLRWEDRVPSTHHATGSAPFASVAAASVKAASEAGEKDKSSSEAPAPAQVNSDTTSAAAPSSDGQPASTEERLKQIKERRRILYTANVGDARIVLCRNGRALRLSYDHKGSDEREGRRVAEAGGLILNNRVNGVLAVTRALGDAYMKDLVTGHPYTTETVINEDQDEFLILACDGLWDVCSDQEAVDLVRNTQDAQAASKQLVDHALARFSTDNLSCMIVRFDGEAAKLRRKESIGVDTDQANSKGLSEAEVLVQQARKSLEESGPPATSEMILEEEEQETEEDPGPELNVEAQKAAQKNPPAE